MKKYNLIAMLVLMSLVLSACAQNLSGSGYRSNQVQTSYKVYDATVVAVSNVTIDNNTPPILGGAAGAVLGGIAGSLLGGGTGRILAAAGGALVGGIGGAVVDKKVNTQAGQEITVRFVDGTQIAIVQGMNNPPIYAGEKVRVLHGSDGTYRVTK